MKCKLRAWTMDDLDSLIGKGNNFNIARFMMDTFPFPYTIEAGIKFIETVTKMDPAQVFAIDVDGEACGSIGLFPQSDIRKKNAEMGYWLAESHWGKGIITDAIIQMINYGFQTWDVNRIFAIPYHTNTRSQKALEKAGFKFEAKLEKTIYKNGEFLDELIYAVRKPVWALPAT